MVNFNFTQIDNSFFFLGPIQGEVLPSFARCMGKQPQQTQSE